MVSAPTGSFRSCEIPERPASSRDSPGRPRLGTGRCSLISFPVWLSGSQLCKRSIFQNSRSFQVDQRPGCWGRFKPMPCFDQSCWLKDEALQTAPGRGSLKQSGTFANLLFPQMPKEANSRQVSGFTAPSTSQPAQKGSSLCFSTAREAGPQHLLPRLSCTDVQAFTKQSQRQPSTSTRASSGLCWEGRMLLFHISSSIKEINGF